MKIRMKDINLDPRWRDEAKCAARDPKVYELHEYDGDPHNMARGLCVGCPVLKSCALDAMYPLAVGTVRGGLWIGSNCFRPYDVKLVRLKLWAVASGA